MSEKISVLIGSALVYYTLKKVKSRQEKVKHPVNWIFRLSAAEKPGMGALLILHQLQCVPLDSASLSFLLCSFISTQKAFCSHHTAIIKILIAIITTSHKIPREIVTATTITCNLPTRYFNMEGQCVPFSVFSLFQFYNLLFGNFLWCSIPTVTWFRGFVLGCPNEYDVFKWHTLKFMYKHIKYIPFHEFKYEQFCFFKSAQLFTLVI